MASTLTVTVFVSPVSVFDTWAPAVPARASIRAALNIVAIFMVFSLGVVRTSSCAKSGPHRLLLKLGHARTCGEASGQSEAELRL